MAEGMVRRHWRIALLLAGLLVLTRPLPHRVAYYVCSRSYTDVGQLHRVYTANEICRYRKTLLPRENVA